MTLMMVTLATVQAASNPGWRHAGGWWWPLFGLLFWIVLAAVVGYVLVHVRRPQQQMGTMRARDILAERLARGEIDPDEYEQRLSHLS